MQNKEMRAYLIWDGHSSHSDKITGSLAAVKGISVISIPLHSSHLTQPLDREWHRLVGKQMIELRCIGLSMPKPGKIFR